MVDRANVRVPSSGGARRSVRKGRPEFDRDPTKTPTVRGKPRDLLSLFTGQGSSLAFDIASIARHDPTGRLAQLVRALP
jgi:hypothetical protein